MENENTSGDVIAEQDVVNQPDQTTGSVTTEGDAQQEVSQQPQQNVGEVENPWKNKAYELERKLGNLTDSLPKIIEENIIKATQQQQPKEREYTIAELEAYGQEHPEHKPWVEEQKLVIQEKRFKKLLDQEKSEQHKILVKQQSEQRVLNHPRYAEAFVTLQDGTRVFNQQSPLAQKMANYYNDPRLAGQADALEIAAKLAYADHIETSNSNTNNQLINLKRANVQLKQQTLVEGGGVNNVIPIKSSYDSARDKLAKTGSRKDMESAVKEYFKKLGT